MAVYNINDRNWRAKKAIIMEQITKFGKPKKIIMDNEFKSEQIVKYLGEENIEIHFTKPNSHTGNADIERMHSTLIEKKLSIDKPELSIEMKMQEAVNNYNNRFHSTIKCSPREAKDTMKTEILTNRVNKYKDQIINKRNESREIHVENRSSGAIRNYKRLRHKDEPYYRIKSLQNIHNTNIKRPLNFTEIIDDNHNNRDDLSDTGATAGDSN